LPSLTKWPSPHLHHGAKETATASPLAHPSHAAHHGAGPTHGPDEKAHQEQRGQEGEDGAQLGLGLIQNRDAPCGVNAQVVLGVLQVPLERFHAADREPERLCVHARVGDDLNTNPEWKLNME
jgi:hypothetical protein